MPTPQELCKRYGAFAVEYEQFGTTYRLGIDCNWTELQATDVADALATNITFTSVRVMHQNPKTGIWSER